MAHNNANYPAFPIVNPETGTLYDGLTKREIFAKDLLCSLLSTSPISSLDGYPIFAQDVYMENLTEISTKYADALLLELSK